MSFEKTCTAIQTLCSLFGTAALGFGYYQLVQVDKQLSQGVMQIKVAEKQLISDSTPEISMYLKKQNSNSLVIENFSDNLAYNLKIMSYSYADKNFCIFDKSVSILAKDSKNISSTFEFNISKDSGKQPCFDKENMELYAFNAYLYNYISSKNEIFKLFENEANEHSEEFKNRIYAQTINKILSDQEEDKRKKTLENIKTYSSDLQKIIPEKIIPALTGKTAESLFQESNKDLITIYILYSDKIGNNYIYSQQLTFNSQKNEITSTYRPNRHSLYAN